MLGWLTNLRILISRLTWVGQAYLGDHVLVAHLALVEDLDRHAHARQVVPRLYLPPAVPFTFANPPFPIVLPNM